MEIAENITLTAELQQLLTPDQAWHYGIVPKAMSNGSVQFYTYNLEKQSALVEELEVLLAHRVTLIPVSEVELRKVLSKYYRRHERKVGVTTTMNRSGDYLHNLIAEANHNGSSDIHLESYEDRCRVRMRIDGKLIERYVVDKGDYPALINKIKISAGLDIAEKRLPQDGRILFTSGQSKFDIRVSSLPTLYGEKVVLRLLSKDATDIDLSQLGLHPDQLESFLDGIKNPHGIVLVSGPTGSGKTTTLYATLKILNREETNILTIEDPIEYTLPGINQVQLKEDIGLTFAGVLRTFLRQDPDVIMLGEIRDGETAQMAIRASLTGHLVLSTIHTNSAWGIISRLVDMGIPGYLLANTLNMVVAQRLVRLLCPHCKTVEPFSGALFPKTFVPPAQLSTHSVAVGCEHCYYTGYKGRKAIYEIVTIDGQLANAIKAEEFEIDAILKHKGIKTLADMAFALLANGETTLDEVYSILKTKTGE